MPVLLLTGHQNSFSTNSAFSISQLKCGLVFHRPSNSYKVNDKCSVLLILLIVFLVVQKYGWELKLGHSD